MNDKLELERIRHKMEQDEEYRRLAGAHENLRKRASAVARARIRGELEDWEADWELAKIEEERESLPPLMTPEEWRDKHGT